MKKAILILLFLICIYGLISKHKPKTDLTYVSSTPKINLEYDVNFKKIVNEINLKIQKLESIKIKNMPVIVYRGFAKRKISGSAYWQKNNYRVLMSDFDFGLNIHEFWYHNGYKLFYASIKDEINLKEYLHPLWIQEIFNVVKIDFDDIEFGKFKNSYIIFKNSFQGTTIVFIIDPIQENIQEKYLYNKKGYLIAEVQYEYDEKKSLKTILIKNQEINMLWDVQSMEINTDIDPHVWVMPDDINKEKLTP